MGERFPLPWELDPSKHTTYDENLLKRMVIFRNKYLKKKEEREEKRNKETVPKAQLGGKGHVKRPKGHVRKPKRRGKR